MKREMFVFNLETFFTVLCTVGVHGGGLLSETVSALDACLSGSQREISGRIHWTTDYDDISRCDVIFPGGFRDRFRPYHERLDKAFQRSGQPFHRPFRCRENKFDGPFEGDLYYETTTMTTEKDTESNPVWLYTDGDCQSWHTYEGHQYCFINSKQTWAEADQKCRSFSWNTSHLVYIENINENKFVEQFFINMRQEEEPDVWIGLDDRFDEGNFKWGGKVANFTNWSEEHQEPNGGQGIIPDEDCVAMSTNFDGEWIDFECKRNFYSICEAELQN